MSTEHRRIRQSELVDESILNTRITVIGAGGIGSFTTLALAKCGFSDITVVDPDTIEEHNIANQFYPLDAVGQPKVSALGEAVLNWTGEEIKGVCDTFPCAVPMSGVVISAVDNMTTRAAIYGKVRRNPTTKVLIDGRMGGQQLEVYTCKISEGADKRGYKAVLWEEEEASEMRCTQRAVIYNVLTIASWIVNQVRLVLSEKEYKRVLMLELESMQMVA